MKILVAKQDDMNSGGCSFTDLRPRNSDESDRHEPCCLLQVKMVQLIKLIATITRLLTRLVSRFFVDQGRHVDTLPQIPIH